MPHGKSLCNSLQDHLQAKAQSQLVLSYEDIAVLFMMIRVHYHTDFLFDYLFPTRFVFRLNEH